MRASDLRLDALFEAGADGGVLTFAGQRVLLLDAAALGLLRKQLVDWLGETAARGVLTRFGYAHGWQTADTLREALPWDDEREWRAAVGRLHHVQGLVSSAAVAATEPGDESTSTAAVWRDSYEAEQHLLHLGPAEEPVCWTLTGFASGYLSRATGRAVYFVEEACVARGDAVCRVVGRTCEAWGDVILPHLRFYEPQHLDASLEALRHELRATEGWLRISKRAVADADPSAKIVGGLVVRSAALRKAVDLAEQGARADTTVLVTGETGVGKERIARFVHDHSDRAARPFVAVDCRTLPDSLLESELFGQAGGATTGATHDRPGRFEAANGGTLYLDEVGALGAALQGTLLRVLEERRVRRVGDTSDRPVDVRVVAATTQDLAAEVRAGRVREDFHARLKVVEIGVPPLRERRDDILPLAHHFLARAVARLAATGLERALTGYTPAAAERLLRHDWPGNVRELQSAVEHAVVVARGAQIDAADLPPAASPGAGAAAGASERMDEVERAHILAVLAAAGGNRAEAARRLDIGTATLFRKLKRYRQKGSFAG